MEPNKTSSWDLRMEHVQLGVGKVSVLLEFDDFVGNAPPLELRWDVYTFGMAYRAFAASLYPPAI